jgi:anhydro-N-acetylmuramic acid kinase
MSLERVLRKKRLTILGLNSGTSADGLDMAVVRVYSSGRRRVIKFIGGARKRYPPKLRSSILDMCDSKTTPLGELVYLDNIVGRFYGKTASAFIKEMGRGSGIDLVASHGQTVRHLPDKIRRLGYKTGGSMQLGSPEFISAATGLPVVSDFRQADIALGNEGAPITVSAMRDIFASAREPRLIVNIGGMSNYFYFPRPGSGIRVRASDCGPGNSLCDILSGLLNGERYDAGGRRARRERRCRPAASRSVSPQPASSKDWPTGQACQAMI